MLSGRCESFNPIFGIDLYADATQLIYIFFYPRPVIAHSLTAYLITAHCLDKRV
ncbi:hypothetical protein JCM18905_4227 [Vibrio sp. JCM 18905]|nr:hypothetical protein JCM18905_4227 [Vibrio sp. JCM 18905]